MTNRRRALALLAAAAGLLAGCRRDRFGAAPVVLISIDTLRADHLPAYGYAGVATPAIDALRKDAILFRNAYSHVPLTLPSHVTLMTGLLPPQSGVRDNLGYTLSPTRPTIASLLKQASYPTGGAVSAVVRRASRRSIVMPGSPRTGRPADASDRRVPDWWLVGAIARTASGS